MPAWRLDRLSNETFQENLLAKFLAMLLVDGMDFVILCVGEKGAGKSMSVLSLYECIQQFLHDWGHIPGEALYSRRDWAFDLKHFFEQADEKVDNDELGVVVGDDIGNDLDPYDFQAELQRVFNHYLQKSRTNGLGYILTVPNPMLISKNPRDRLSSYRMEVHGHNKRAGFAMVKFHKMQVNLKSGDIYFHNLCLANGELNNKGRGDNVRVHDIPLPTQEAVDWYVPVRKELGRKEAKTAMAAFHREPVLSKEDKKKAEIEEYGRRVLADLPVYQKEYNKKKYINKADVRSSLGVGNQTAEDVISWVKKELTRARTPNTSLS